MSIGNQDLLNLLPGIITQARDALANLRMADLALTPAEAREADPKIDLQAAMRDQNYYRLLRLTTNLTLFLSLSQKTPPPLQDLNLVDLVGELCEEAAGLGEQMELNLRFICAQESILCAVDRSAVGNILLHLLSNAFRVTPKGGLITVDLRRSNHRVLLSVQDAGPGLPDGQRETLFLSEDASADSSFQGAGLGLLLSVRLAQRQGAALVGESLPEGRGSRFTLSLRDQVTGELASPLWDFSSGVNRVLLGLADVLPTKSFLIRYQEDL